MCSKISDYKDLVGEYIRVDDKQYILVYTVYKAFSKTVFAYGPMLSLHCYHSADSTGCLTEMGGVVINSQCLDNVKVITREEFNAAVQHYIDKFLIDITRNDNVKEHNKISNMMPRKKHKKSLRVIKNH